MNYRLLLSIFAGALALSSCSVSTPMTRIRENPALYESVPAKQKPLVASGQIAVGMTPPEVFLAWGHPSSVAEGVINGNSATRWIYSTLQPVYTPPPAFWTGPYWGGPWRPGLYAPYYPYYNDVTYVPVNTGYVLFINGKVKSWEQRR